MFTQCARMDGGAVWSIGTGKCPLTTSATVCSMLLKSKKTPHEPPNMLRRFSRQFDKPCCLCHPETEKQTTIVSLHIHIYLLEKNIYYMNFTIWLKVCVHLTIALTCAFWTSNSRFSPAVKAIVYLFMYLDVDLIIVNIVHYNIWNISESFERKTLVECRMLLMFNSHSWITEVQKNKKIGEIAISPSLLL